MLALGFTACQPASGRPDAAARHQDVRLAAEDQTVEARVPRNATLESLLRQNNLPMELTAPLIDAVRGVYNPREIRADRTYQITRTLDGLFREFSYQIDTDRLLRVVRRADAVTPAFSAEVVPLPKDVELDTASVEITKAVPSLVGAFDQAGENLQLPLALAEIFGGEVDFNSDLQQGDKIQVLFERETRHGEFIGYGDIKGAILETGGRRLSAIRFVGPDGKPGWYDDQGRSLRRQFLKSPLPFDPRVTSRFSLGRLHPVHGDVRPHLGVDYGAPYGTPVKAAAAGVVESAGWAGEAGRMVKIRHAGGYETAYLHLSSFAPGVRPGSRVSQGDLIGRVGNSGTATGAHLDYRILKNGRYVNPLSELSKMPPGEPIAPAVLSDFQRERDDVLKRIDGQ